jgi:hypothetical protein
MNRKTKESEKRVTDSFIPSFILPFLDCLTEGNVKDVKTFNKVFTNFNAGYENSGKESTTKHG